MQRFWRLLVAAVLALGAGVALAAPASAAVAIVLTPTPAPAQIGGMLNVAGTGCPASSPVFVKIASTVHPAANTSASGAANGAGEFSVDVALLSSTATPFTPGQQLAAAAYCSATNDPLAPHKIEFFTPALLAAPVVTLAVADTQVWGRSEVLYVTVDPAADGLLTVLVDGELLETENYYWLGSAQYTLPADLAVGPHTIEATFDSAAPAEEGVASRTITVVQSTSTTTLAASASSWRYGASRPKVTATIVGGAPGEVHFTVAGRAVGTVAVVGGKASLTLPARNVGRYAVAARFVPSDPSAITGSSASLAVRVTKASAVAKIKAPKSVKAGKKASVTVRVKVKGVAKPTGKFAIYDGKKKVKTFSLKSSHRGKRVVKLKLKKGIHKLSVRYLGSKNVKADKSPKVKVRAR